jgi:AAA domain-containing protein
LPATIASLGGVKLHNTADLLNEHTKLCLLLYAGPKFGKTTVAASMDAMTRKFFGKPTLFIAVEPADGGGTMSIQHLGVDFVMPNSWSEFTSVIASLASDKTYGGVVLDNVTDLVKRFIMPYCIAMPYEKAGKGGPPATRALGVPAQGDYQTAAEVLRTKLNELMNLTRARDTSVRKHLAVVALEKNKTDRDGNLIRIQPDLPGAMAEDASAMFNTIASIAIKTTVEPLDQNNPKAGTHRVSNRILVTEGDGVKILGDRMKAFPKEGPTDLCEVWEKHFLPRIEAGRQAA